MGILSVHIQETVRNREVSIPRSSTVFVKHAYVVLTGFYKNHSRMSHEIVPVKCI